MPTYPVINLETKEKKELNMSMKAYSSGRKRIQDGIKTGQKVVQVSPLSLSGLVRPNPMDGMRSWIVHLNNQVQMSAKTDTTVNPSNLL